MPFDNVRFFVLPVVIALALVGGFWLPALFLFATLVGIIEITRNAIASIKQGDWSLDYIAFLALTVSLMTREWLAGAVTV